MGIEFIETISKERLGAGKRLKEALSDISTELKNGVICFRIIKGNLSGTIDEDLDYINYETTIDVLCDIGLCYVDEDVLLEFLQELEAAGLLYDHRAWSVFTVLEVRSHINHAENYMEAVVLKDGDKINNIDIDLVSKSDEELKYVTCKFKASNQIEEANRRGNELRELSNEIETGADVVLGTFDIKQQERIESELETGEFDMLILGTDLLDLS